MILTDAELMSLSAVSGGGRLPGLPHSGGGEAQALIGLKGLQTKDVLDRNRRVTRWGMIPVRAVEQYRIADRHVFVNQVKLSVNADGALTVIHPAPDGWSLARMTPIAVMLVLLRAYPFLCQRDTDTPTKGWEPLSGSQWASSRPDGASSVIVVRDTSASKQHSHLVTYDSRHGMGFAYDMTRGQGRSMSWGDIRHQIAGLLGCDPASPLKEDSDV